MLRGAYDELSMVIIIPFSHIVKLNCKVSAVHKATYIDLGGATVRSLQSDSRVLALTL